MEYIQPISTLVTNFFSVNTVFFTLLGYPMSYLEFFGTILNLWCVWLVARNSIWNWPIGNIAVILFGILFYQIQLYSDMVEQIYFLITGFYGWWIWSRLTKKDNTSSHILKPTKNEWAIIAISTLIGTGILGWLMGNIHELIPTIFTVPASFAYLDAFTTVMSFVATILMAHKKLSSWYLWILVDIIGIWLYFTKGVVFISLLYAVFLILATRGLFNWKKLADSK
ncbi:MAG: Nicotinamide riboside transporter PnuC [Microgenomates bacterium OLB22]|nr:MAG: Nicotinamide riboside transporter PnuC [Microgenomates bacterium OLB22]